MLRKFVNTATTSMHLRQHSSTRTQTVPRFMQFASHVIACGRYMVITDHTSTGTITTDRTSMQHYRFRSHVAEVRQHRHNFDALASTFINTCPDCSAFDAIRITCYRMWATYGHKLSHFDRNHNNWPNFDATLSISVTCCGSSSTPPQLRRTCVNIHQHVPKLFRVLCY